MSSNIFVPVFHLPLTLEEVAQAVYRAFEKFNLPRPHVQLHVMDGMPKPFADSFVMVQGEGAHERCWISFDEYPAEVTGEDGATHMGDVTTRGSWLFAAIVVLALFEFGGSTAFNDAGELDGRSTYDIVELHQLISDALALGKQYMAR